MDLLQIKGIDYVEFYVGNAFQTAHFFRTALGFTPVAHAGLETGISDQASFVMEQGNIRLVLTGAIALDSPIAKHVALHGDSIRDVAFRVDDVAQSFEEAVKRGAYPIQEPTSYEDSNGQIIKATIAAFGDTVHSFVQRKSYQGTFFPSYQSIPNSPRVNATGLKQIDHIAICVEAGDLAHYSNFYHQGMGFHESYRMDLDGPNGMNSRVMENSSGLVKFVICEPASRQSKSQIQEYLRYYGGAGVQHLAFTSNHILETVQAMRVNGFEFLNQPDAYYDALADRVGQIDEDIAELRQLNILADRDEQGYLLQAFTKLLQDRPTLFLEVIQRRGTRSFGQGNIKALFEAVQQEQAKRGNG
jgi:4-hydroxyphenylpyruvate dioxygenase